MSKITHSKITYHRVYHETNKNKQKQKQTLTKNKKRKNENLYVKLEYYGK